MFAGKTKDPTPLIATATVRHKDLNWIKRCDTLYT